MDTVEGFPRKILKICFVVLIPLSMFFFISAVPTKYEAYYDGIFIGYVNNKADVKNVEEDIVKNLKSRFNGDFKLGGRATFKKVSDTSSYTTSKEQLQKNIISKINFKVNACSVNINGEKLGYLACSNEGENLIDELTSIYISKLKLKDFDIENIEKKSNIIFKDEEVFLKDISTTDEILKKVIQNDKKSKDKLINIKIESKIKEQKDVEPPVIYKNTNDLFMGEKKKVYGTNGKKEITKRIVYENDKVEESTILKEEILEEPKSTIIYVGTKNPIEKGVKFLASPSRGSISSPYGERGGKIHHGMDIASDLGAPIVAAFDGVVKDVSYNNIYGNKIVLDHGKGIETLYGHCSEFLCKKGDSVKRGDTIGKVGNTGNSTGPHLHFELRVNGKAINPNTYIN